MEAGPAMPESSPHDTVFPILTIVILSTVVAAALLIGALIAKCCPNSLRLIGLMNGWLCCIFRTQRDDEDSFIALSPTGWAGRGLARLTIREIPAFQFVNGEGSGSRAMIKFSGCAVCLNDFQERDVLRSLPNCSHTFHSDCIDIWLRGNPNCPLCRSGISSSCTDNDRIVAPSSSPQDFPSYPSSLLGGDENFVVIELMGREDATPIHGRREDLWDIRGSKPGKYSSMGDECVDIMRDELQEESPSMVQPMIRRSFSLDSAADRHIYLSVQAAIQGKSQGEASEGRNGKSRGSLFSFSHGRRSRNAVRPLNLEL